MTIRLAALDDCGAIKHAFFTRQGGVSKGFYASLNCGYGSGDDADLVEQNRTIAMRMLGLSADRLVTCRQIHSVGVVTVATAWRRETAPAADGMVTNQPGLALGVLAADCAPVLLCDPAAGVIGAAHAGWRGALRGVAEATVDAMENLGAQRGRMRVAIGPCIGPASYEVGPEFPPPIVADDPAAERYFAPARRTGHFMFDLARYVEHRLSCFGVPMVERAPCDTLADPEQFFSYRRARLRGESAFGLGLSAIAIDG
jgi:purine-nucleoside/S-methyl-5'-thioadenosine phosphorylase / adenosine deaminase